MSQEEVGRLLGVTRSAIKNWENGHTQKCRLKNYYNLRQFLNGTLEQECHLRRQILDLRHLLHDHTPTELRHSFLAALKIAEKKAGGMAELLKSLEQFLRKIDSIGKKYLRKS